MPTKHDRATQEARIRYIAEKRKRFTLNLTPEEFDSFRTACERKGTTPTTEIRRFMAEYIAAAKGDIMKYWFIIDDETARHSEVYTECLPEGTTEEQAAARAEAIWERKTRAEQNACDQLYIGYAEPDEDSDERHIFPDYNTMTDIRFFKQ